MPNRVARSRRGLRDEQVRLLLIGISVPSGSYATNTCQIGPHYRLASRYDDRADCGQRAFGSMGRCACNFPHIGTTSSKGYGFDTNTRELWNFRFEDRPP